MVPIRRHARDWGAYLACGGLVLALGMLRQSPKQRGRPEADGKRAEEGTLEAIAAALHRAEKRYLSKHDHQESPSGHANKIKAAVERMTTSEWLMVFFTAVIAVVGGVSAYIANGQQEVMKGQLNEMAAEQRPWLFATEFGAGTPHVNANGIAIEIVLNIQNAGHLPAWSEWVSGKIFPYPPASIEHIPELARNTCSNLAAPVGQTIFPGQPAFKNGASFQISKNDFANKKFILPFAIVCVNYKDPSGSRHFTPYFYDLLTIQDGRICCAVPTDQAELNKSQIGIAVDAFTSAPPE